MIEGCQNNEETLAQLAACKSSKRICQCHAEGIGADQGLAAFLIGAYRGTTENGYAGPALVF